MKSKILLGIILSTFVCTNLFAQDRVSRSSATKAIQKDTDHKNRSEDLKKPFRFGAKLGLNMATIPTSIKVNTAFSETRNTDLNTKYIPSYYFGCFTDYAPNNKNLKLQAEILFTRNGSEHSGGSDIRMDEILVPLVLKYDVLHNSDVSLNIYGGVFTGFIIKAISQEDYENALKYDVTSQYKSFDSGLVFGVDYAITDHIIVDTRFNYGLLNISKASDATDRIEGELTSYNRFFHFGINYIF